MSVAKFPVSDGARSLYILSLQVTSPCQHWEDNTVGGSHRREGKNDFIMPLVTWHDV